MKKITKKNIINSMRIEKNGRRFNYYYAHYFNDRHLLECDKKVDFIIFSSEYCSNHTMLIEIFNTEKKLIRKINFGEGKATNKKKFVNIVYIFIKSKEL